MPSNPVRASLPANAPKGAPESSEAFAARVRNTLLKGFAIPLAMLIFFAIAPRWLDHNLHTQLAAGIAKAASLSASTKAQRTAQLEGIDFEKVCTATPKGMETARQKLEAAGICGQFRRLRLGMGLSVLLVIILTGVTLMTFVLNRRASQSRTKLINSYRFAWRLSTAAAIVKVLLLIPLLGYGCFELTTLAAGQYLPMLIAAVVIGGAMALWRSIQILLRPVPLEFQRKMVRAVTEKEAPLLWSEVRDAAARVGTAPPDSILVGMEQNFFVTELAVVFDGGRTAGRTLYLSYPLMRQLSPDEVMSIVGHELGHFLGEDTLITREFYPMRHRAMATMKAMAASGWVGWTSVHSLLFFHWSFARTENEMSRQRELEADRIAAKLTSPETVGRALMKIHIFAEAFNLALARRDANPFDVPMAACVRDELAPKPEYWVRLFERTTAHPLDSHPPLRARLQALEQPATPEAALAVATVETESAFGRWFAGQDSLFAGILGDALKAVDRVRTAKASYATEEGRRLLDQKFPEVIWPSRRSSLWFSLLGCAIGAAVLGAAFAVANDTGFKCVTGLFIALFVALGFIQWRRHHGGRFVLRADSLSYSGWKRPLVFADVERVAARSSLGTVTLYFRMKSKGARIWRCSPLGWMATKNVTLAVGQIAVPKKEVLQTFDRYFSRKS
jgi:Zn-dependent protease with chaperone function